MTSFQTRVLQAMHDGVIEGDGHTIFSPEYYAPHFTVDELRKAGLIQNHRSDMSLTNSKTVYIILTFFTGYVMNLELTNPSP